MSCKRVGVLTTTSGETFIHLASSSLKNSRPTKRARLELEEEEEESASSFEVLDQQDTTYESDTESSQRQWVIFILFILIIVFLRDLEECNWHVLFFYFI